MKVNVNKKKVVMGVEKMRERNRIYKRKNRAKKKEEMTTHQLNKKNSKAVQSYNHNVKCDKYLYHDLMETVAKLQKEKKFDEIGKLINTVTYVEKVMTTKCYREDPKNPQSPFIAASAIGKGKRSVVSFVLKVCTYINE